eukprot:scaffold181343_cov30-Tisochrysis_lutea.AAC.1
MAENRAESEPVREQHALKCAEIVSHEKRPSDRSERILRQVAQSLEKVIFGLLPAFLILTHQHPIVARHNLLRCVTHPDAHTRTVYCSIRHEPAP